MTAAEAFIFSVQHDPFVYSPIDMCRIATVCKELSAIIALSWKRVPALADRSDAYDARRTCGYCARGKPTASWDRCKDCAKTAASISATQAKAEFYLKPEVLDMLPCIYRQHRRFRSTTCFYFLRRDVVNAALVVYGGPKGLSDRLNRSKVSKAQVEREAKIADLQKKGGALEGLNTQRQSDEWQRCIENYISNGKGGVRELIKRYTRYKSWIAEFRDTPINFASEYIDTDEGLALARARLARYEELTIALVSSGLTIRPESWLCDQYIYKGQPHIQTVVLELISRCAQYKRWVAEFAYKRWNDTEPAARALSIRPDSRPQPAALTMKEIEWLYTCTDYKERMAETQRNIRYTIRQNCGFLMEHEYYMIYHQYAKDVSEEVRNEIRAKFSSDYPFPLVGAPHVDARSAPLPLPC
jgi:hypothetical protein